MLPGSKGPKPSPAAGPQEGRAPSADRFAVILARPESAENIGLVARAMKNTGFSDLRIVKRGRLPFKSRKTAVHSGEILDRARVTGGLEDAVADLHLVFAATAKPRSAVERLPLDEAVRLMAAFPPTTRVGILFGNERTGLTAAELRRANFAFTLPQAGRQPSYNLAAAVLLTLFSLFTAAGAALPERETPLPRREQEDVIRLILRRLEENGFIHGGNRDHVATMMHDLLGRLAMNEKDRRLLLALFTKGVADRAGSGVPGGAWREKLRLERRSPMRENEILVTLPGGTKADAHYKGFVVKTDQPILEGGENSAPSPFDLFLASLATCAGYFVAAFCRERKIPTEEITLTMSVDRPKGSRLIAKIAIVIHLPQGFPEKYRAAVIKAAESCTVKIHLAHPSEFVITTD